VSIIFAFGIILVAMVTNYLIFFSQFLAVLKSEMLFISLIRATATILTTP